MDRDEVEVHKNTERERGQYPAILTELAWSIKDLLYGIKSTEKVIFVLVYFPALKRKPVVLKSDNAFRFSRFLVPSRQRNHRKSFYCHGKYFAKENFRAPAWTSAKCYCGNKTGNPERPVSLHLARSGSQSQRGIWFILPARGACHITKHLTRSPRSLLRYRVEHSKRNSISPRAHVLFSMYETI